MLQHRLLHNRYILSQVSSTKGCIQLVRELLNHSPATKEHSSKLAIR